MRHLFVIYFGACVAQLMNIPLYFRGHIYLCLESLLRVAQSVVGDSSSVIFATPQFFPHVMFFFYGNSFRLPKL